MSVSTTINMREVSQFSDLAEHWWDENGAFAPLHRINPVRLPIIKRWAGELKGKRVLDVGCGGGIVCEPLARMGAKVTGIDGGQESIEAAKLHATQGGLNIDYYATPAEDFAKTHAGTFDVVLALEIIEHVDAPALFLESLVKLAKPGGLIILSTLNRTPKSLLLGKFAAEYVLGWVPKGTHEWRKFKKPSEIAAGLKAHNAVVKDITGMSYDLRTQCFAESSDTSINYFLCAVRES